MHSKKLNTFSLIMFAAACLFMIAPADIWAASPVIDIRISTDWDDSEERVGSGSIDDGSSDLELSSWQLVGMRFPGIPIPQGSTITNAYIVFTTDEVTADPTSLSITMEDSDNPGTFTIADFDISSRPTIASSVAWNDIPAWNTVGASGYEQQTPDLTTLVQQMVDRPGWAPGNAMVFIITGSGDKRTAESYDGSSSQAPLLHIEYTTNELAIPVAASNDDAREQPCSTCSPIADYVRLYRSNLRLPDDADEPIGIRFQNINIAQGTIIEYAYVEFTARESDTGSAQFVIHGQAADSPPAFEDLDNNISARTLTGQSVTWSIADDWVQYQKYNTPDISPIIQEIVGRPGWTAGNNLVLIFNSPTFNERDVCSYDHGDPDMIPVLHIRFGGAVSGGDGDGDGDPPPPGPEPYITIDNKTLGSSSFAGSQAPDAHFTLTNSGSGDLNYTMSKTYNNGTGWMTISPSDGYGTLAPGASRDFTVIYNSTALPVGTYQAVITFFDFAASNNPQEINVGLSVITPPEPDVASCGNVPVYMDITTAPAVLVLLDISSSMGSTMDVASMPYPKTPDLKTVVQEIVDRPSWVPGNAMAFLIQGSGKRVTRSFEGQSGSAPLLHVEYSDAGIKELEIRIKQGSDDAEEKLGLAADIDDNNIEMVNDSMNQTIGLRFQNVTIPQGAVITNAYIEFFPALTNSEATGLTIYGQYFDDPPTFSASIGNLSNRTKTTASVNWSPPGWTGVVQQSRIDIGKAVIAELVKDRSINWGYGNWCEKYEWYVPERDYTLIQVGTKTHTDAHQATLQSSVDETEKKGGTPFFMSIEAARKYFKGQKREWVYERNGDGTINESASPIGSESGDYYTPLTCQQKFLIDVTDGRGGSPEHSEWWTLNPDYVSGDGTDLNARRATRLLAEAGVSTVAVGFGLEEDDAGQLYEVSREANIQGKLSEDDEIYALHEEDANGGVPYFAFNKQELLRALTSISDTVKGAIFHGSAPAAATSTDLGDVVVVAKFDGSRWTGDVEAVAKDNDKFSPTYGDWLDTKWKASEQMPITRKVYTINPSGTDVIPYTDATLATDNWLCKNIGDIINSTPIVVGTPPYWYNFDNYRDFVGQYAGIERRDSVVYIGANDGSLHAFDLFTGQEKWAFVPKSMHDKLNLAGTDSVFDMCDLGYCHQYFVDGSPQAGDVFADFGSGNEWRTILVTGLREGGQSYFALDVTSGKSFDEADPDDEVKFLWEFTDDKLGQTWNDAAIERVIVSGGADEAWGVFFGSGYSPYDQSSKMSYIYGILAHNAGDLWKDVLGNTTNRVLIQGAMSEVIKVKNYPLGDPSKHFAVGEIVKGVTSGATAGVVVVNWINADLARIVLTSVSGTFADDEKVVGLTNSNHQADMIGNVVQELGPYVDDALSSPLLVDLEADYISDRIYTGNLYGDMFRITNIGKGQVPVVKRLFSMNQHLPNKHPIRAKADFAYCDPDENCSIWVYFGTGIYEEQADKANTETQYFFGLKDTVAGAPTYEMINLVQTQANFTTATIDGQDVVFRTVSGSNPDNESWVMELAPGAVGGERVIVKPLVVGGILFFTTFVPDANVCEGSGDTYVFAVDYNTGLAPANPVFDLNGDGNFSDEDKITVDGNLVVPAGIFVGRGQGSHPVLHKNTLFITTTGSGEDDGNGGGGGLKNFSVNIDNMKLRLNSWRQQ